MSKLEKIDSNKVQLTIEVPEAEVEEALSNAYRKVVKKVSIPGFRKGKVPRRILETRFGSEILYEDALGSLLPSSYIKAVKEEQIEPIDDPELKVIQMEKGKPLLYVAKVCVKPEVKLGKYKGIEVEQIKEDVTEEKIDRYLEDLREKHARFVPIEEEREVKKGDFIAIDVTLYIDGLPFEGGQAENYSLEVGAGNLFPDFEDQLVGLKMQEERSIKVTFPEDYFAKELAGKDAVFNVTVNEIKQKELSDLDDSFVREISEFQTLEEYRSALAENMKKDLQHREEVELESKILQKVVDNADLEVPKILVERQVEFKVNRLKQNLNTMGLDWEQFLTRSGSKISDIEESQREDAKIEVAIGLVLEEIMKKEGIEVDEQELIEKRESLPVADKEGKAYEEKFNPKKTVDRGIAAEEALLNMMREEARYRKVIDFLVAEADIKVISGEEKSD